MTVENDIYSYVSSVSLGAPCFIGPVRPSGNGIPVKCLFVQQSGGFAPDNYMDGTHTAYRFSRAQIRVRGEPNAYESARNLAGAVWSLMHQGSPTGAYTRVTCEQSEPLYLGRDAFQCDEFSVNLILEKRH